MKNDNDRQLKLSGNLESNLQIISRHTFTIKPDATPLLAIRLRKRKYKLGENSRFLIIEKSVFVKWLNEGGTPALYLDKKCVSAKFKKPDNKSVSVARFIAGCADGESVKYLNGNVFDLRRSNLARVPGSDPDLLPNVSKVLKTYRQTHPFSILDRDIGFYLVCPDYLDFERFEVQLPAAAKPRVGRN